MDEEMEQRGAKAYAEATKNTKHIAAIEADRGGFTPLAFPSTALPNRYKKVHHGKTLLLPYGLYYFEKGGSGVDVGFLKSQGVPLLGLVPDSQRYFDYHHSINDSFDKVNIRELQLGSAAMGAIVFLIDEYGLLVNWRVFIGFFLRNTLPIINSVTCNQLLLNNILPLRLGMILFSD